MVRGRGRSRVGCCLTFAEAALANPLDLHTSGSHDPALCAAVIMHQIQALVGFANTVVQSTVDCAQPGLDELSCSSDVISIVGTLLDSTAMVLDMVATCGDMEYTCAHSATRGVLVTLAMSSSVVTVAGDCKSDPWLCAYDVISLVDYLNGMAVILYKAIADCQLTPAQPGQPRGVLTGDRARSNVLKRYIEGPYVGNIWGDFGMSFERRLQEAVDARKGNGTASHNIDEAAATLREQTRLVLSGEAELPEVPVEAPKEAASKFSVFSVKKKPIFV